MRGSEVHLEPSTVRNRLELVENDVQAVGDGVRACRDECIAALDLTAPDSRQADRNPLPGLCALDLPVVHLHAPHAHRPPTRLEAELVALAEALQIPVATSLNGKAYEDAVPPFRARIGDLVRWRVVSIGQEVHTWHVHGHRWLGSDGAVTDNVQLAPGMYTTFEFIEDKAGEWLTHCHVPNHMEGGMIGRYVVDP